MEKYLETIELNDDARACFEDIDIVVAQNIETTKEGQE